MHNFIVLLVVFLSFVTLSVEYSPFRLTDCSSDADRLLTIRGHLLEHPIEIPGHVLAISEVNIHRPVVPGHLRLDVIVEKWILFDYFALPCISKVGSCSYDACELISLYEDRGCPWQLEASNFPCTCPFHNGTYTLDPHPFYIPQVRSPWQWIAFGDFRVSGVLVDEDTSTEVACYSLEFTTQSAPTFWTWW